MWGERDVNIGHALIGRLQSSSSCSIDTEPAHPPRAGEARITPGCDLPARFVIHTGKRDAPVCVHVRRMRMRVL